MHTDRRVHRLGLGLEMIETIINTRISYQHSAILFGLDRVESISSLVSCTYNNPEITADLVWLTERMNERMNDWVAWLVNKNTSERTDMQSTHARTHARTVSIRFDSIRFEPLLKIAYIGLLINGIRVPMETHHSPIKRIYDSIIAV